MLGLRIARIILERDLCSSVISHNVGDEETSFIALKPELVRSRHLGAGHFERRSSPFGNLAEKEVCCDENCFYITKVVKVATFNEKNIFFNFLNRRSLFRQKLIYLLIKLVSLRNTHKFVRFHKN
jgi:hypothetical protein